MNKMLHKMKHKSSSMFHTMVLTNVSKYEILRPMAQKGTYPNNLKNLREKNNLTQDAIGRVWKTNRGQVSKIESGEVQLTYTKHRQLKEAFGWTASMVFGDIDPKDIEMMQFMNKLNDIDESVSDIQNELKKQRKPRGQNSDIKPDA